MRPRLVVTRGHDRGREYELRRDETAVGRGRANHIVLRDPSVSRHHLSIIVDADGVLARDEGSGNGTLRNGTRFAGEVRLGDGDELEVGDTVLRLVEAKVETRALTGGAISVPEVRERPARRDLKPAFVVGGGVIAAGAVGVLVVALWRGGDPPPPPLTVAVAAPPAPMVISALPEAAPPPPAPAVAADPAPRRRRPGATPTRAPAGALRTAAERYAARDFAEAVRLLRELGDDGAVLVARDYALVGAGLARGDANAGAAPQVALAAYQDALAADARSGDGAHEATLRARIAKVAPGAARAYLDAGRLEQARAACDLAVNFGNGGDPRVGETRARLEAAAEDLYARATALAARDAEEAKLLYRRVVRIVPAESPWSSKALAAVRGR